MIPTTEATFTTIVAGVVSASTFQLLDAAGDVVMELASTLDGIIPFTVLNMAHLDPAYTDSKLEWSQGAGVPASGERVRLVGPKLNSAVGSAPALYMDNGGGGLSAQQNIELHSGIRDAFTPAAGDSVLSLVSANAGPGYSVASLSSAGDIEIGTTTSTGRVFLGIGVARRAALWPLGCIVTQATANLALLPGFAFIAGIGQNLTMEIGDMAIIDLSCDMAVPASGFVAAFQITIQNPNLTFSNPTNAINYNLAGTTGRITGAQSYVFTATQQGNHNFNAGGNAAVGGFIAIATHTVLRVQHWGIR